MAAGGAVGEAVGAGVPVGWSQLESARIAKAASGDAASSVLDTAMRVCGGLAFRKDVGVERRFRDARAALVMAPTSDQLYDFIGRAVCGMELFD